MEKSLPIKFKKLLVVGPVALEAILRRQRRNVRGSFCPVLVTVIVMQAIGVRAETITQESFEYKSENLGYLHRNEIFAAWDPTDAASILAPGLKVLFWGRAVGCDSTVHTGPVTNQSNRRVQQAAELTGIPLAPATGGQYWAPTVDPQHCDATARSNPADSFVHLNESSESGGIGIFTFTGPNTTDGRVSFFRQYDHQGKGGRGINSDIAGTFVTFRFAWQGQGAARPWTGGASGLNQRALGLRTVQSVATVATRGTAKSGLRKPIQAKQQIIVEFINQACAQRPNANVQLCQIQYLLNTAVFRDEVKNWGEETWFTSGGIIMDAGQTGIAVVHGPIPKRGESVTEPTSGFQLYTSMGEPSQHETFKDKNFLVQISFQQFMNALRLSVAKTLRKSTRVVADADLTGIMGAKWNDPNEWVLLSATVAQEVHNPDDGARAFIGGSFRDLEVKPSAE